MKQLATIAQLLIFVLSFNTLNSATLGRKSGDDTLQCLTIKGKINNASEGSNACKVELISSTGVIDISVLKNGQKKFEFTLDKNSHYAIRISKKGFVTKLVSINTEFPAEILDVCNFAFNTELISEDAAENLNKDALDFPVAIIHFDETTETFIYNKEYTFNIKQELTTTNDKKMLATASNH